MPCHQSAVLTVSRGRKGHIPHFNSQQGLYACAGQTENLNTVLPILLSNLHSVLQILVSNLHTDLRILISNLHTVLPILVSNLHTVLPIL
ncbi:hypothetical protein DPMN_106495 [Dreissena polymorpha]|uniref:Uncharacterized protein n=1 Tax=Dreissena polymorpha TaxID=45954 RepID=A0A9D4QK26_DREPO|nr:hypothetical protein DPMN_106495 [Dreissena polymorpha]